jgi:hypothetical protein
MPRVIAALLAASAVALAGCGNDGARPGTLTVTERWTTGPFFIEGHVAFASINELGGRRIAEGRDDPLHERAILVRRLGPGRYRVAGWVRSCGGDCGVLDPPSEHCSAVVAIDGDTAVTFVRDHRGRGSCRVEIEQ